MNLKIFIPEKILFEGDVKSVKFNGDTGEIEILPNHTPLFTKINLGELEYDEGKEKHQLAILEGFAQIGGNEVKIVLNNAVYIKDINLEKVEEAKREAEEMIKHKGPNKNLGYLRAQLQLADLHLKLHKKYYTNMRTPNMPSEK